MKLFLLGFLIVNAGCTNSSPESKFEKEPQSFVKINDPEFILEFSDIEYMRGIYIDDAPISSRIVTENRTRYILSKSFGVALGVPESVKDSETSWAFDGCAYSRLTNLQLGNSRSPQHTPVYLDRTFHTFHSVCKSDGFQNFYIVSAKNKLLAFEIIWDETGNAPLEKTSYISIDL